MASKLIQIKDFIEYYKAYRELRKLHVKLGFGTHPQVPSGFSERLCKLLCELEDCPGRAFDAAKDGKAIEIKATGSSEGTTTINLKTIRDAGEDFGGVIWVYLDGERDELHVVHIPPVSLEQRLKNVIEKKDRETIRLSSMHAQNHDVYVFDLEKVTLERRTGPQSDSNAAAVHGHPQS